MKLFQGHKNRTLKVKNFAEKNKVFIIMLALAITFLFANFMFNQKDGLSLNTAEDAKVVEKTEIQQWRFYPIDLVILGVGGGFCTVMLIRERKRTKEELK